MKNKLLTYVSAILILCILTSISVYSLSMGIVNKNYTEEYLEAPDWYSDARKFVVGEYIMTGFEVNSYPHPDTPLKTHKIMDFYGEREISRGEILTILSRFDGSFDTLSHFLTSVCDTFIDVPDGKWFTPAVNWAYENGITSGVGGGYFAPDRTITREEFAALLYRYTEYREAERGTSHDISTYPDSADVSDFAVDAMKWAVGCGLISGKPGGLLAPKDTITRAEVALIMYRYNNVVPHLDEAIR